MPSWHGARRIPGSRCSAATGAVATWGAHAKMSPHAAPVVGRFFLLKNRTDTLGRPVSRPHPGLGGPPPAISPPGDRPRVRPLQSPRRRMRHRCPPGGSRRTSGVAHRRPGAGDAGREQQRGGGRIGRRCAAPPAARRYPPRPHHHAVDAASSSTPTPSLSAGELAERRHAVACTARARLSRQRHDHPCVPRPLPGPGAPASQPVAAPAGGGRRGPSRLVARWSGERGPRPRDVAARWQSGVRAARRSWRSRSPPREPGP